MTTSATRGLVPVAMLPAFFRGMVDWNPTGLGVDLVTGVAYLDRTATGWPVVAPSCGRSPAWPAGSLPPSCCAAAPARILGTDSAVLCRRCEGRRVDR